MSLAAVSDPTSVVSIPVSSPFTAPEVWRSKLTDLVMHVYCVCALNGLSKLDMQITELRGQILLGKEDRDSKVASLDSPLQHSYMQIVSRSSYEDSVLSGPYNFYSSECVTLRPDFAAAINSPELRTALKCHFAVMALEGELRLKNTKRPVTQAVVESFESKIRDRSCLEKSIKVHSSEIVKEFIAEHFKIPAAEFVTLSRKLSSAGDIPALRASLVMDNTDESTKVFCGKTSVDDAWYIVMYYEGSQLTIDCWVERAGSYSCWDFARFPADPEVKVDIEKLLEYSRFERGRSVQPVLPSHMMPET